MIDSRIPQRNTFTFEVEGRPVVFNSDFDSGNLGKVQHKPIEKDPFNLNPHASTPHFNIWTASDCSGEKEGYSKSWFYFSVEGFEDTTVRFSVYRLHVLYSLLKCPQKYRPVYRFAGQAWKRLENPVLGMVINCEDELIMTFEFYFPKLEQYAQNCKIVEFAYTYPYSYETCQSDLQTMRSIHQNKPEYYFKQHLLIKSPDRRNIDMIMISSHEGKAGDEEITDNNILKGQRIQKFEAWKPVVLITARVHPVQTPSSYCMQGILDFLVDLKDARAYFLRKYFVFVLVPMLNPDGVSRGHCRMDIFNQNLNRHYKNPSLAEQPSCYAIKHLAGHYSVDRRLFLYLDLHAHPGNKGNFIFGNAINDFVLQVQSSLFPKILSQNCINFEFDQCNFSRKHMKAKDKYEDMNKEGCGRVVFYKEFGIIHSYTLECGYHCNIQDNVLKEPADTNKIYRLRPRWTHNGHQKLFEKEVPIKQPSSGAYEQVCFTSDPLDSPCTPAVLYTEPTFRNLGRNILISILDIWNKNPYPRSDPNALRRELAHTNKQLLRFKKEHSNLKVKEKLIVQLIEEQYYMSWYVRNIFNERHQQFKEKMLLMNVHSLSKRKLMSKQDEHAKTDAKGLVAINVPVLQRLAYFNVEIQVSGSQERPYDSHIVLAQSFINTNCIIYRLYQRFSFGVIKAKSVKKFQTFRHQLCQKYLFDFGNRFQEYQIDETQIRHQQWQTYYGKFTHQEKKILQVEQDVCVFRKYYPYNSQAWSKMLKPKALLQQIKTVTQYPTLLRCQQLKQSQCSYKHEINTQKFCRLVNEVLFLAHALILDNKILTKLIFFQELSNSQQWIITAGYSIEVLQNALLSLRELTFSLRQILEKVKPDNKTLAKNVMSQLHKLSQATQLENFSQIFKHCEFLGRSVLYRIQQSSTLLKAREAMKAGQSSFQGQVKEVLESFLDKNIITFDNKSNQLKLCLKKIFHRRFQIDNEYFKPIKMTVNDKNGETSLQATLHVDNCEDEIKWKALTAADYLLVFCIVMFEFQGNQQILQYYLNVIENIETIVLTNTGFRRQPK